MSEGLQFVLFVVAFIVVSVGGLVLMAMRHSYLKRRGGRDFQALAEHFGFRPLAGVRPVGDMGAVGGTLEGYEALIAPDSIRKLRVRLKRPIACDLRTSKDYADRPEGTARFDFPGAAWNKLFETRHASPAMAGWLRGQERPGSPLHGFLERWQGEVGRRSSYRSGLEILPDQVACTPRRGAYVKHMPPHVRFADVRDLLPDLVALAAAIDAGAPHDANAGAVQAEPAAPAGGEAAEATGGLAFDVEE